MIKNMLLALGRKLPNNIKDTINRILGRGVVKIHPMAASNGISVVKWIEKIHRLSIISINNFFEIGANYGQDAEFLRHRLHLDPKDVYAFEPHPQIFSEVKNYYQYNAFDYAISNRNGKQNFHAIDLNKNSNSGISSLLSHSIVSEDDFFDIEVTLMRMDHFMEKFNVDHIDFVKIDVEGCTYEVLDGFGERIKDVKCIQLESEHQCIFNGQKLFDDIAAHLQSNGFVMVYFEFLDRLQSDSLWIRKEFLK